MSHHNPHEHHTGVFISLVVSMCVLTFLFLHSCLGVAHGARKGKVKAEVVSVDAGAHSVTVEVPRRHVFSPIHVRMTAKGPDGLNYAGVVVPYEGAELMTVPGKAWVRLATLHGAEERLTWIELAGPFQVTITEEHRK